MTTFAPPTPILADDLAEQAISAPESLRPWFTELARIPAGTDLSGSFTHIPQAATTIVLRAETGGRREALVIGPRTRASYSVTDRPASCTRVRIAPGAVGQLLGVPAVELTDRILRLGELPGVAAELADDLAGLDADEIFAFLAAELPKRISEDRAVDARRGLLRAATAALSGSTAVHASAAELSVSERQLRNLFTAEIGVSPKLFARIGRVRHVITRVAGTPLAQIAADSGYYDQSHMAADFKALMGVAPTGFFRGDLPAPTACANTPRPGGAYSRSSRVAFAAARSAASAASMASASSSVGALPPRRAGTQ